MDSPEIEIAASQFDEGNFEGTLVELILAASEGTEDMWEIGDRVDSVLISGRFDVVSID